jgi:hypothetical protein
MLQTSPTDFFVRSFDQSASPFAQAGAFPLAGANVPAADADGIATPWFQPPAAFDPSRSGGWAAGPGSPGAANPQGGTIASMISSLIGTVQQLVSSILGGNVPGASPPPGAQTNASAQQFFANADVSSTGDPHLAIVGTREGPGGNTQVDQHFDSMTSHRDLLDSADVGGGYRVSTTVSPPDANGVTTNRSATVHAGFGQDAVTMRGDGSFSVVDDGGQIALGKGQTATLSGGETVTENQDGSLVVSARGSQGGSIATTLRAVDGRVDVTAHASGIDVGGDVVNH